MVRKVSIVDEENELKLDSFSKDLPTIDTAHKEMHEGDHYFNKAYITLTTTTAQYFMFTTPTVSAARIHAKVNLLASELTQVSIYEDATVSAMGTSVTTFNNDRNSANTPELQAFSAPTVTGTGTTLWRSIFGGSGVFGQAGVSALENYEIIAKSNTKYLFEIIKQSSGTGYLDYDFFWYENS